MLIIRVHIFFRHECYGRGGPARKFFCGHGESLAINITFHVPFCIAYNLWIISSTPARIIPSHDPPKTGWESRQKKHFRVTTWDLDNGEDPCWNSTKTRISKNLFGALGDFWDTSKRMGIHQKKFGDHMFDVFVERMFTGVSFLVGEITTILGFQNLFETVLPHETTLR